ncbi:hypothetical protein MUDAN_BIHEEGNE_03405 [Lactiplantibacillus mudanjiangensis]|nr:hypothetical protein MUDAN_BIHEEGNE_03405 [Lactiplantibacillus mudanjiangensis]
MTVRELINRLEDCENLDSKVYFSDARGNDYWVDCIDDRANVTYIECRKG